MKLIKMAGPTFAFLPWRSHRQFHAMPASWLLVSPDSALVPILPPIRPTGISASALESDSPRSPESITDDVSCASPVGSLQVIFLSHSRSQVMSMVTVTSLSSVSSSVPYPLLAEVAWCLSVTETFGYLSSQSHYTYFLWIRNIASEIFTRLTPHFLPIFSWMPPCQWGHQREVYIKPQATTQLISFSIILNINFVGVCLLCSLQFPHYL